MDATFPKSERLCGKTAVEALFEQGKSMQAGCLRCRYLRRGEGENASRVVISVPKRHFKRAVKRNLNAESARVTVGRNRCWKTLRICCLSILPGKYCLTRLFTKT